jgi:hypothetical protein
VVMIRMLVVVLRLVVAGLVRLVVLELVGHASCSAGRW